MSGSEHRTGEQGAGAEKGTEVSLRKGGALTGAGRGTAPAQATSTLNFLVSVDVCVCTRDGDYLCSPESKILLS